MDINWTTGYIKSIRFNNKIIFCDDLVRFVHNNPSYLYNMRPIVRFAYRGIIVCWEASCLCIEKEEQICFIYKIASILFD